MHEYVFNRSVECCGCASHYAKENGDVLLPAGIMFSYGEGMKDRSLVSSVNKWKGTKYSRVRFLTLRKIMTMKCPNTKTAVIFKGKLYVYSPVRVFLL
jgi:hypothetical protein